MTAILDTIDHAIADWETSPDAMRWTPDPPPEQPTRQWVAFDTTPLLDSERLTASFTFVQAGLYELGRAFTEVARSFQRTYGHLIVIDEAIRWPYPLRSDRVRRMRSMYRQRRR